jgi:hypothetical protein
VRRVTEVTTPASDLSLVSLELVKDELDLPMGDFIQDARLLRYIKQCSADVHSYCRRIFPVQTYKDSFVSDESDLWSWTAETVLQLSNYPVAAIESLTEGTTVLGTTNYRIDSMTGKICRVNGTNFSYWSGQQTVVQYTAGFDVIPDDVIEATLRLVTMRAHLRGRDPMLKVREGPTYGREEFWVGSMPSMAHGMPYDIAQKLDVYVPIRGIG